MHPLSVRAFLSLLGVTLTAVPGDARQRPEQAARWATSGQGRKIQTGDRNSRSAAAALSTA